MTDLHLDLLILGLTAVTIVTRSLFMIVGDRFVLPRRLQQGLRYAPVCALVALIVPQVLTRGAGLDLSPFNPRLDAALAAAAVMYWRRDMLSAMGAGMLVLFALRWLS
jgi:branched-subunit amino acid transport protein